MNTGGVLTGTRPFVGSQGSPWTQATYVLGNVDVTDLTRGGASLVYPDLSFVEETQVISGTAPVDVGTPGVWVRVVPRRGPASWRGEGSIAGTPAFLAADGPSRPPPIARLRSLGRLEASGGGAVGAQGIRVFGAVSVTRSTHQERNVPQNLPGNTASAIVHLTARDDATHNWEATAWAQRIERPFEGRFAFANTGVHESDGLLGTVAGWQTGGRWPIRVDAGIQHAGLSVDAAADAAHGTIERLRDGPVQELLARTPVTRDRIGANAIAAPPPIGRHTLKFGVSASRFGATASPLGGGLVGETVGGLAARAWNYGYEGSDPRHVTLLAAHAADHVEIGSALSAELGFRFDHTSGTNGSTGGIAWNSVDPRVAIGYATGAWTFMGSARRYHQQLTLDALAFGDPAAPAGDVYRWTDANGDGLVEPAEIGPLIARVGPGTGGHNLSSIDTSLHRPHVSEGLLGIERTLGTHWTARFSGVHRHTKVLLGAVNVGVPPDQYTVSTIFDPGLDLGGSQDDQQLPIYSRPPSTFGNDRYLLTNIPSVTATYSGLYIGVGSHGYERWRLLIGATTLRTNAPAGYRGFRATENDETILGDAFSDPNSTTYAIGRVLFDRGYGVKLAATYSAPHRITLGTVARYADGQNFARLVLVPDLPQGPDVVRAYKNGLSKFTYTMTVDLRVAKALTVGRAQTTFVLDAFNALNTSNEVEENPLTGPAWRTPTSVQPPRVIRIGLRLEF